MNATFRTWKPDDDVEHLTAMLHRAYAPLAAMGLRYTATYQTSEVTKRRLTKGHPFIAEMDGRVVGTLTLYPPDPESSVSLYRDPETGHLGQFAIEPEFQGLNLGRMLHDHAVKHARNIGLRFLGLDTASPANDLIATYERWGYRIVDRMQFETTNYESVIMRLALKDRA